MMKNEILISQAGHAQATSHGLSMLKFRLSDKAKKICRNLQGFGIMKQRQNLEEVAPIFMAFSEYVNFTDLQHTNREN